MALTDPSSPANNCLVTTCCPHCNRCPDCNRCHTCARAQLTLDDLLHLTDHQIAMLSEYRGPITSDILDVIGINRVVQQKSEVEPKTTKIRFMQETNGFDPLEKYLNYGVTALVPDDLYKENGRAVYGNNGDGPVKAVVGLLDYDAPGTGGWSHPWLLITIHNQIGSRELSNKPGTWYWSQGTQIERYYPLFEHVVFQPYDRNKSQQPAQWMKHPTNHDAIDLSHCLKVAYIK